MITAQTLAHFHFQIAHDIRYSDPIKIFIILRSLSLHKCLNLLLYLILIEIVIKIHLNNY